MVVEVGGGAGEVGGVGEGRGLIAEVGAREDGAGGDGRIESHLLRDPIIPMPMVPATVHELPIESATTAQIRQAVT